MVPRPQRFACRETAGLSDAFTAVHPLRPGDRSRSTAAAAALRYVFAVLSPTIAASGEDYFNAEAAKVGAEERGDMFPLRPLRLFGFTSSLAAAPPRYALAGLPWRCRPEKPLW